MAAYTASLTASSGKHGEIQRQIRLLIPVTVTFLIPAFANDFYLAAEFGFVYQRFIMRP